MDKPGKAEFELLSQIDGSTWYAVKRDAFRGTKYIAQALNFVGPAHPVEEERTNLGGLAFHDLLFVFDQSSAVGQIFNHENIVSIAGHIQSKSLVTPSEVGSEQRGTRRQQDFVVWDFCDAANLSTLFEVTPFRSSASYLPESLCWHVLTSLLKAVTYLHDGRRLVFDPKADEENALKWIPVDLDWNPILHRAIEPRNIFFQHPQGLETYGLCKLGDFSNAAVTNHYIDATKGPNPGEVEANHSIAIASRSGWEPWLESRFKLEDEPEVFTEQTRPYTLSDEIWSIGSVIFTMMTGEKPILYCPDCGACHLATCSKGGCVQDAAIKARCRCAKGGCEHVSHVMRCLHEVGVLGIYPEQSCRRPIVNIDSYLTRAEYSWQLRKVVKDMLDCDPGSNPRISRILPFTQVMLDHYKDWKTNTGDGREYKDLEDDMIARMQEAYS